MCQKVLSSIEETLFELDCASPVGVCVFVHDASYVVVFNRTPPQARVAKCETAFVENPPTMAIPTDFYYWWFVDEPTGQLRRTAYKLSSPDAERAFPGATPDLGSREMRIVVDPAQGHADTRPGD